MATPVALGPPSGPHQKDAPRKAKKASYGPGVSKTLSGKFQARIVLDGKRYDLGSNFATADDAAAAYQTAKCAGRTDRPSPKHERVQRGTGTPLLLLTSIPFLCSMLVVATRMTFGRNEGAQSVLRRCDATAHHARVLASKYYNEPARTITRHTTTTSRQNCAFACNRCPTTARAAATSHSADASRSDGGAYTCTRSRKPKRSCVHRNDVAREERQMRERGLSSIGLWISAWNAWISKMDERASCFFIFVFCG